MGSIDAFAAFANFGFNVKGAIDANKTARKIGRQKNTQYKNTVAYNTRGYELELRSIDDQTLQGRAEVIEQIEEIVAQTLTARGQVAAAGGRGGVAGQSLADTLDEVERQASVAKTQVGVLGRFRERNADVARAAAKNNLTLRNLGARPSPTVVPDFTTALLQATSDLFIDFTKASSTADGGTSNPKTNSTFTNFVG